MAANAMRVTVISAPERDCAIAGDEPRANRVVVIGGVCSAHALVLLERRLDVPGFVDRPAHDRRGPAVPLPEMLESRVRARMHLAHQCRGDPCASAIGADVDTGDLSAS